MAKMSQKEHFNVGDSVVYPSHGVGEITGEENQIVAGTEMKLYVISFSKDKMLLRIPKSRAIKTGLRHLTDTADFSQVIQILQGKAKTAKGMWSKRAQEYESKINSGDVKLLAEVLRDLHKNVEDPERSYSERIIYESALDRLSHEYAASYGMPAQDASEKIVELLDNSEFIIEREVA